jgi:glycosyltransferase involved in cell wall biosynthesis
LTGFGPAPSLRTVPGGRLLSTKLCIDAFNLSLSKGSGIATYARNLNLTQDALGYDTQILFGPSRGATGHEIVDEAALFDAAPAPNPSRKEQKFNDWRSVRGQQATRIDRSGEVILDGSNVGQTKAQVFWSVRDLFHSANRAYGQHGRFTPVHFGKPPQRSGADLMHWTCPLPIKLQGAVNVYTIHDLVPLRLPHATLDHKRVFHALCAEICRTADHVVTVSEATRQDVIRLFGITEDRITNTYQAVSTPAAMGDKTADQAAIEIENVFGLAHRRYFLFFGAIEPKKNIARLIEAYLSSGVSDPLIIIGGQAWLEQDQTRLLHEDITGRETVVDGVRRREKRVRVFDYLPQPLLVSLIRGAKATLFPSLYEGFGLPVLESMSLGTPVLTATTGALPEVAGQAAVMVDPYNVDAIKQGILALDQDGALRDDLAGRGLDQALQFSPQRYRDRMADLYSRVL